MPMFQAQPHQTKTQDKHPKVIRPEPFSNAMPSCSSTSVIQPTHYQRREIHAILATSQAVFSPALLQDALQQELAELPASLAINIRSSPIYLAIRLRVSQLPVVAPSPACSSGTPRVSGSQMPRASATMQKAPKRRKVPKPIAVLTSANEHHELRNELKRSENAAPIQACTRVTEMLMEFCAEPSVCMTFRNVLPVKAKAAKAHQDWRELSYEEVADLNWMWLGVCAVSEAIEQICHCSSLKIEDQCLSKKPCRAEDRKNAQAAKRISGKIHLPLVQGPEVTTMQPRCPVGHGRHSHTLGPVPKGEHLCA